MKKILLFIIIIAAIHGAYAQKTVSGVSKSGYVNISKDPPKPPYLEIVKGSLRFADVNDNNKIDANEQSVIFFQLKNSGSGPGLNLKVSVNEENNISYLSFGESIHIGELSVGKEKQVQIPISAGMDIPTDRTVFNIKIDEANGFDSDPVQIEIKTRAFREPLVKVVDYKVSSQSTTLQKRRPFDVQVLIQNIGEGVAENVTVKLPLPKGIFCLSDNANHMIGNLEPGEEYLIDYNLVTNTEYSASTIPLDIKVSENYGRYAENRNISLSMNQSVSNDKLVIKGGAESKSVFKVGSLTSSVDKNIPVNSQKFPNRIALIIGNEDYSQTLNAEVNVDYARNDAEVFRQYALSVLGVEEKNMHFILDATAGKMDRKIDLVTAIMEKLGDKGELIFYYAGHGFPDENSKVPYLIPVDVDATNLNSAVKLSEVYKKFGESGAGRITVFLDACFSGGGRNQGLLAARGVAIKPKNEVINGNMVVFSATSGKQSALPYKAEKHGMFTYFLLEKIQQTGGEVSYGELSDYLNDKVGIESLRENGKPQDPEVNISNDVRGEWKMWTIK